MSFGLGTQQGQRHRGILRLCQPLFQVLRKWRFHCARRFHCGPEVELAVGFLCHCQKAPGPGKPGSMAYVGICLPYSIQQYTTIISSCPSCYRCSFSATLLYVSIVDFCFEFRQENDPKRCRKVCHLPPG